MNQYKREQQQASLLRELDELGYEVTFKAMKVSVEFLEAKGLHKEALYLLLDWRKALELHAARDTVFTHTA